MYKKWMPLEYNKVLQLNFKAITVYKCSIIKLLILEGKKRTELEVFCLILKYLSKRISSCQLHCCRQRGISTG